MKSSSRSVAYSALAAALGTVLMYLASAAPTGKLVILCVASLCTVFVLSVCGWKWALASYAVTAALSLILSPSKASAILFSAFFGYYPIVKIFVERLHTPAARWGIKLGIFNAVMAVLFFAIRSFFQGNWGVLSGKPWVMLLLANGLFVLYDLALQQGILYFIRNIARRIR